MVSSVCGGNQVRSTKTSLSRLQSSMVVGVSWSGAAWVLPVLGSYSSLRRPWMPTCTVTYWSRAWSPPFKDWAAGQYCNMIMTTALLKKLSQAWWWECHGLGLHECCRYWEATVLWGDHECQHVLWHTEAEHDPLPSKTGPQGSIATW